MNFPSLPNPSLVIGIAAVVTLLGAAVWVQTARLDTAQLQRDQALQVAKDNKRAADEAVTAKELADKAGADRLKQEQEQRVAADKALAQYRGTAQGDSNACHFAVVDPSVDRLLTRPGASRSPSD